jgi:hypothetical protein
MTWMKVPMWPGALLLSALVACSDHQGAASDSIAVLDSGGAMPEAGGNARAVAGLERAARQVVGFLRSEVPFDSLALTDTVELRVAPEGGNITNKVSRHALRDPSAWTIAGQGQRFPLVPPADYSTLSTRVGRHFNCHEQDLATRAPDLASRPHVGAHLRPDSARSCLQSWNATFVFDTVGGSPRLKAIFYDQWEW